MREIISTYKILLLLLLTFSCLSHKIAQDYDLKDKINSKYRKFRNIGFVCEVKSEQFNKYRKDLNNLLPNDNIEVKTINQIRCNVSYVFPDQISFETIGVINTGNDNFHTSIGEYIKGIEGMVTGFLMIWTEVSFNPIIENNATIQGISRNDVGFNMTLNQEGIVFRFDFDSNDKLLGMYSSDEKSPVNIKTTFESSDKGYFLKDIESFDENGNLVFKAFIEYTNIGGFTLPSNVQFDFQNDSINDKISFVDYKIK